MENATHATRLQPIVLRSSRVTCTLYHGDCIEQMRRLPDNSVHCCVTSPPYWGLRDYGHEGQIGLEDTPEAYVARMVEVFREVRRVLRDDGTLWLNLGDSYAAQRGGTHQPAETLAGGKGGKMDDGSRVNRDRHDGYNPSRNAFAIGLKHKDLVGIPWRVAFALQADGWWLRQDIIWHKPNPMPESVTDRCTKSHEYVFLLTKSERYFYDAEAVKEAALQPQGDLATASGRFSQHKQAAIGQNQSPTSTLGANHGTATRNRRSVWSITTKPFKGAHFAVMPPDLVEPCIMAGTSEEGCCPACGKPWERVVEKTKYEPDVVEVGQRFVDASRQDKTRKLSGKEYNEQASSRTTGWRPACTCGGSPVPCTAFDPFAGSGTTLAVAADLGRNAVGTELNEEYIGLAVERIRRELAQERLF